MRNLGDVSTVAGVRGERRTGVVLLAMTIGLGLLMAGCGAGSAVDGGTARAADVANREVTVPIADVVTAVVDPGASPREQLGPRLPADAQQRVVLQIGNRIKQRIGDQPEYDLSTAGLHIPLLASVTPGGVDLTVGDVTSDDEQLAAAMHAADGSHIRLNLSPAGAVTAVGLSQPAADQSDVARAALERAFYQAAYQAVAFPQEPIGVGATWTIDQKMSPGLPLNQRTTAHLVERDGDLVRVAVEVRQLPKDREWDLPGGAGALHIDDYDMAGSGELTVDLTLPLPVRGAITIEGTQSYTDPTSGTTLFQTIGNEVRWGG